ncbi:MAG TPA: hypothetical protein VK255_01865 [Patescibacteria group bacterium]|nr:hypothetical protein [Patescibacteria group bacterium]
MKKNIIKNKKGFSVIEILFIIIIITILVTIILINMLPGRDKAKDNSAFTSLKTMATSSFMCLGTPGTSLVKPASSGGNNICSNISISEGIWKDMPKTGWSYSNFCWCSPNYSGATHPTTCVESYANGAYGGDNATGEFCFMMKKDEKFMWCTLKGCYREL